MTPFAVMTFAFFALLDSDLSSMMALRIFWVVSRSDALLPWSIGVIALRGRSRSLIPVFSACALVAAPGCTAAVPPIVPALVVWPPVSLSHADCITSGAATSSDAYATFPVQDFLMELLLIVT